MISVCIPVYNFDSSKLVKCIGSQLEHGDELIVIDDCSSVFVEENKLSSANHTFIALEKNHGRAKIRNLFLKHVKNNYLLFLDCDSLIIDSAFIKNYRNAINPDTKIICGGRVYPKELPSNNQFLSWNYGVLSESKNALERKKNPNDSFMTNNFLVAKTVLEKFPFNESISQYGHEDTLFGITLEANGIEIEHIENPILNGDIETNEAFLIKTEKAIANLVMLFQDKKLQKKLQRRVKIVRFYTKTRLFAPFILLTFMVFRKQMKKRLIQSKSPLWLFNFYKLGRFIETLRKSRLEKLQ